ncbi:MarR family winged helix-turn-helix transcriptional regulator [Streptomyces sp. RTd22]|uniref:MarR family winged helix-turn-helix transcriptional regulator n=1 Tax=Streptomyces sp. RTd22 TaxID=1841249 RepID=UPI0007C4CB56|nr:MarR family winged helix-turn-helix transcriptional regulator [Streptomyces sp. RTd22]
MNRSAVSDEVRGPAGPTMLYLVKQLELAVRARLDEVLRPVSITPPQYAALTVLERRSDLSTAELARNSFVTDQSAADMVAVIEERGLVSRVPDPRDRRRRVLRLTDAGQGLLDRVREQVEAVEAAMLSPLTTDQHTALRRYVTLCRSALSSTPPQ